MEEKMTYEDGANLVFGYMEYSVLLTIAELELLIKLWTKQTKT